MRRDREAALRLLGPDDDVVDTLPVRDELFVHVIGRRRTQDLCELVQLVPGERHPKTARQRRIRRADRPAPTTGIYREKTAGEPLANWSSEPADASPEVFAHEISCVPAEQLVAPIAREAYRHSLPGQPRDEKRRDLRRIGEGLVIDVRKERDHRKGLFWREIKLRVLGS